MNSTDKPEENDLKALGHLKRNPYYDPPPYREIGHLSTYEIAIRMKHLEYQIDVLEEAAMLELIVITQNTLFAAASCFEQELDSLRDHLRQTILEDNIRQAQATTRRQSRNAWYARPPFSL